MNLTDVRRPNPERKHKFRVGKGHGSGLGKTCGRGGKGQSARTGYSMPAWFEGGQMPLIRRVPKRGFTNAAFKTDYVAVNVGWLAETFPAGATADPKSIDARGVGAPAGMGYKVLGTGEIGHALTVKAHAFSGSARAKIEKAGGTCEVLPPAPARTPPKKPKSPPAKS